MVRQSRPFVVILTRPAEQGARFARDLAARAPDLRQIVSPLMAPEFLPFDLPDRPVSALILTSVTAVQALQRNGGALPARAYCVGARTAAEAQALGLEAQSADGDAEALVRLILSDAPPPPLLHLHGAETRGEIAQRLNSAGLETFSQVIYCQKPQPLADPAIAALRGAEPVFLPVFSPRTAQILADELDRIGAIAPLRFAAISEATAAPLRRFESARLDIAAAPQADAMLAALARLIAAEAEVEPEGPKDYLGSDEE